MRSFRHSAAEMNPTGNHEVTGSMASLTGLRIQHCYELWCESQTRLGSATAVALAEAGSCSSDWTPSLGTSICRKCGPEKCKNKQKTPQKQKQKEINKENSSTKSLLSIKLFVDLIIQLYLDIQWVIFGLLIDFIHSSRFTKNWWSC